MEKDDRFKSLHAVQRALWVLNVAATKGKAHRKIVVLALSLRLRGQILVREPMAKFI